MWLEVDVLDRDRLLGENREAPRARRRQSRRARRGADFAPGASVTTTTPGVSVDMNGAWSLQHREVALGAGHDHDLLDLAENSRRSGETSSKWKVAIV